MDARSIISKLVEDGAKDNASAILSDSQMKIAQEIAQLKDMQAGGADHVDLQSAVKYLEAGAILLGRIIQRNIQKP